MLPCRRPRGGRSVACSPRRGAQAASICATGRISVERAADATTLQPKKLLPIPMRSMRDAARCSPIHAEAVRHRHAPPAARASGRRAGRARGPASRAARRHVRPTHAPALKALLLLGEQRLQARSRSAFTASGTWSSIVGGGRAGARAVLEGVSRGVADLRDEPQRRLEIRVGLAGEADDEIAGERDVRPRGADALDERADSRRACGGGSSP